MRRADSIHTANIQKTHINIETTEILHQFTHKFLAACKYTATAIFFSPFRSPAQSLILFLIRWCSHFHPLLLLLLLLLLYNSINFQNKTFSVFSIHCPHSTSCLQVIYTIFSGRISSCVCVSFFGFFSIFFYGGKIGPIIACLCANRVIKYVQFVYKPHKSERELCAFGY